MIPSFKWAQAKSTGPSHLVDGIPCQDAVSVRAIAGRNGAAWIVAALADGAGSARHATVGAQYAVECFVDFVSDALGEIDAANADELSDVLRRGSKLVKVALSDVAGAHEHTPSDYAATFLGCVSDGKRTAFIQIGDGAIIHRCNGAWSLAFVPQRGRYANETQFITGEKAMSQVELVICDTMPDSVVLFSDGLEELLVSPKTHDVHPPLPNRICDALASVGTPGLCQALSDKLGELLKGDAVTSRNDDDTSIIVISFTEVSP